MTGQAGRVGSEVGAICGKCGVVWHIVIALNEDRIVQVQCGECGARHRYRPSGGAPRRRSIARKSSSGSRMRDAKPIVEADTSRPSRFFSPKDTYQVGDRMVHPAFGEGVVQATLGATKVEVLFGVGTKLLVQGQGRS